MITKQVIEALYKKYKKQPESPDCLDMPLLFENASHHHHVSVDMDGPVDSLIIRSVDPRSPFHRIPLEKIHAIVPFEEWVAIVLHSSIVFLSRESAEVSVHIKPCRPSLMERVKDIFSREQ